MKITFDSEEIQEMCSGCEVYGPHFNGATDGHPVFKCRNCNRLTVWMGGDHEKVVNPGTPPTNA